MLIAISTVVLLLIGVGWKFRACRIIHIPCMATAMLLDFCLLVHIEWSRHALATLQTDLLAPASHGLMIFHVSVSALFLFLYVTQTISGILILRGVKVPRRLHRYGAYGFITFRLLNYITSFFVVG